MDDLLVEDEDEGSGMVVLQEGNRRISKLSIPRFFEFGIFNAAGRIQGKMQVLQVALLQGRQTFSFGRNKPFQRVEAIIVRPSSIVTLLDGNIKIEFSEEQLAAIDLLQSGLQSLYYSPVIVLQEINTERLFRVLMFKDIGEQSTGLGESFKGLDSFSNFSDRISKDR